MTTKMLDIWKTIATGAVSMIFTGLVAWWSFGGGVKADEVQQMIVSSPAIVELKIKMAAVESNISDLKREIKENDQETQAKLNAIIQALPNGDESSRNRR